MANEVWIVQGKNKVRLTTKRGVDIAEDVNDSLRATLQRQTEEIIGKVIMVDSEGNPLSVLEQLADIKIVHSLQFATRTVACPAVPIQIPGITVADAFDANDCFGTQFVIKVPKSGRLNGAIFYDLDDEGSQVDLEIFSRRIAQVASDAAFAPTDAEALSQITELQFFAFDDHGSYQTSEVKNFGKDYVCPSGEFYIQAVTRSTPNIAANNLPHVQLFILSDDPDWKE